MLYYLSQYILSASEGTDWQDRLSGLRVVQYITFRSAGGGDHGVVTELDPGAAHHQLAEALEVRSGLPRQG